MRRRMQPKSVRLTCAVPGCGKPLRARGKCWAHYQRELRREHGYESRMTLDQPVLPRGLQPVLVRMRPQHKLVLERAAGEQGVSLYALARGILESFALEYEAAPGGVDLKRVLAAHYVEEPKAHAG